MWRHVRNKRTISQYNLPPCPPPLHDGRDISLRRVPMEHRVWQAVPQLAGRGLRLRGARLGVCARRVRAGSLNLQPCRQLCLRVDPDNKAGREPNGAASNSSADGSGPSGAASNGGAGGGAASNGGEDGGGSHGHFWQDTGLRRNVSILIGSQIMLNVGVSQVVPCLPVLATDMGLGATGIGMLMAAPAIARLALNLPYGRVADTVGRKPLMRWGTLVTALGSVGTGLLMTSGLGPVLASRLLVGAGTAASMTGSSAMMADITDAAPKHRAQIMAIQSFVLSGAWVVGPVLGGVLAETHGVRNSFYAAGLGVGLCSLGYSQLPETLRAAGQAARPSSRTDDISSEMPAAAGSELGAGGGGSERGSESGGGSGTRQYFEELRPLLASRNVQAFSALALASSTGQACFMAVLTLHARQLFDAAPTDIGMMFSLVGLSYVAGGPVGGWLANRTGRKELLVPGLVLSNIAFGGLALATCREDFFALVVLSHFAGAVTAPALATLQAEVVPPPL